MKDYANLGILLELAEPWVTGVLDDAASAAADPSTQKRVKEFGEAVAEANQAGIRVGREWLHQFRVRRRIRCSPRHPYSPSPAPA